MQEQKLVNGRIITYMGVIHHYSDSKFGIVDRIKVLIHGRCSVHSEIYTKDIVNVVTSTGETFVPPIFTKKRRGLMSIEEPVNKSTI